MCYLYEYEYISHDSVVMTHALDVQGNHDSPHSCMLGIQAADFRMQGARRCRDCADERAEVTPRVSRSPETKLGSQVVLYRRQRVCFPQQQQPGVVQQQASFSVSQR